MKKIKPAIFLIMIIVLITLLLQIDDDLDPRIQEIVAEFQDRNEIPSNAYLYLNGISSMDGADIIKTGQSRLMEYRLAEKNARITDSYLYVESFETQQRLQIPSKDSVYYCKLWNKGCLQNLTEATDIWGIETDFRSDILDRYPVHLKDFIH